MTTEQLTVAGPVDLSTTDLRLGGGASLPVFVKHGFDRLAAAMLLAIALPLFVLIAVAVGCTSRGPVFYRQERPGQHGRCFRMWKFRTMVDGAERRRHELLRLSPHHGRPLFKTPDDPRITRVGRLLRKYSLDELPQLINVVRGEMSLVGPRPHQLWEVEQYGPRELARLRVRPGLTGLWQVSGRSSLSWEAAIALDLDYVERWSLRTDAMILLRTPLAVLRGEGAY
jgi:lipopolysaccharide/colanic/teichoic acid biosynthesis glycosyltransferase